MGTRILIILVVLVVLLAIVALVIGASRPEPGTEREAVRRQPPGYARLLDRAFGWMAPGFDLTDLTISGATLDGRRLILRADQEITLRVKPKPDADRNSCRSLTLALQMPTANGPTPMAVELEDITLNGPLPDEPEPFEPPEPGQLLPNARLEPDPITGRIDPRKFAECAIPVFRGGATIVLRAQRDCTIEIR